MSLKENIKKTFPGISRKLGSISSKYKYYKYSTMSEKKYSCELKKIYFEKTGMKLNLDKPQRFTEKIQYRKLYDRNPLFTTLSDKYEVRQWIKEKIGDKYLIPLLGVWDTFDEIDFSILPNEFVLKTNHGSNSNIIVRNKSNMDFANVKKKMDEWLSLAYGYTTGFELQYLGINRKVIAEQYISELGDNLFDYKIHCFHGEPCFIQVIGDRNIVKHTGFQLVYDFDWNIQNWSFGDYPKYSRQLEKPDNLEEMYSLAKVLSEEFDYVRVDLYNISGKILFGEMTFTPGSGFYSLNCDWTESVDQMLGDMW